MQALAQYSYAQQVQLAGYIQVSSTQGRLFYLPESIHRAVYLEDIPLPTVFQGRSVRPHRIHIARVAGHLDVSHPTAKKSRSTVSIFFGKLAGTKGKRFFRSFKTPAADKTEAIKVEVPSPPIPVSQATPRPAKPRPRRPLSWAPGVSSEGRARRPLSFRREMKRRSTTDITRSGLRQSVAAPISTIISPPLVINEEPSPLPASPTMDALPNTGQKIPDERPIASGNGISVGIALAEPYLFLQGFEQADLAANRSTAMLRGSLHLKVTKIAKIKAVTLKFTGKALTKWPEGIPPKKAEFEETNTIMSHTWPFFNAQFPTAEHSHGADHIELQSKCEPVQNKRMSLDMRDLLRMSNSNSSNPNLREDKRLSIQTAESRSFGRGESMPGTSGVTYKGWKTFLPGDYIYNFELPLDSHLPETIDVELGSVKYELEASVERSGTFKANLLGTKEITVIRTPAENSLEQVEPIAISRNWDDQLHYDIVISGKSFPLGSQIPIAFKLTPLAKVQCHRIKVYVTESAEYYCSNKRVHRTEPARKILLFEKRAGQDPVSSYPGSTMRVVSGGGIPYDMRAAAARGDSITGADPNNLLGNLEGNDRSIGPTEMEFNVQLPTCSAMAKAREPSARMHFDTTYTNIQVHHWIKIVLRLSRQDANDPSKRRHFEISIDSPFHILSCRATQANTSLPAYSPPVPAESDQQIAECGCPNASVRRNSPTFAPQLGSYGSSPPSMEASSSSTRNSLDIMTVPSLQAPPAAHLSGDHSPSRSSPAPRPMHIIRAPSYNPPAFDEEEPPPPLQTPPPQYDDIASPTTGLADYFSRLSDAYSNDASDSGTDLASMVDVEEEPEGMRTPTNRRSLDMETVHAPAVSAGGNWI